MFKTAFIIFGLIAIIRATDELNKMYMYVSRVKNIPIKIKDANKS